MDFTISCYRQLLESLQNAGFFFKTYAEFTFGINSNAEDLPLIVLRHDVDSKPINSLRFARIQAQMGIKGTYYFRVVPKSFDKEIINEISKLGHEIGYHYETMDTCNGNIDKAYDEFCSNLEKFRKITKIETISMHGSPLSKFDNRDIWKKYDYKKLGILAEPYFDINFNELYYITDTGRRWDGHLFNVRDKATKENPITNPEFLNLRFHSTQDIIIAVEKGIFPKQAMLNFHPQRWNDNVYSWFKELIFQNAKNQIKRIVVLIRK
jgi:hypothetical protein